MHKKTKRIIGVSAAVSVLAALGTVIYMACAVAINKQNFPDDVFRKYVSDNFDKNNDGKLSIIEINKITQVELDNRGIESLKGIEFFKQLHFFSCTNNQLNDLDVSKNRKLKILCCDGNCLTELDVSKNPELNTLSCKDNRLSNLDVSMNQKLKILYCSGNRLNELKVCIGIADFNIHCDSDVVITR